MCTAQLVAACWLSAAGCRELGYADFDQIVVDPDLEFLRQDSRFQVGASWAEEGEYYG
jgi:hypothetical protein